MKTKVSLLLLILVALLMGTVEWTQVTDMPTGRDGLGIGVVDDIVYCIGGWTAGNPSTATGVVEAYNPITDSWITKASMPTPRGFLAVCVLNNKIYALGGWNATSTGLTTAEVYDPASNSWASLSPMQTGRNGLGAETVNGKIYAVGGFLGETAVVEEYDTLIDTWVYKTPMPTTRFFFASEVADDKIYILGGRSGGVNLGPTYIYEPAADTTGGTCWQTGASIPTPRYHLEAAVVNNTTIFVCGGLTDNDLVYGDSKESRADVATVELYDTWGDVWIPQNPMLAPRRELDVGVTHTWYLYAIGGWPIGVSNRNEQGFVFPGINEGDAKKVYGACTPTILTGVLQLPKNKTCRVFNVMGKEIKTLNPAPGIYFVEINGQISRKIIKIK